MIINDASAICGLWQMLSDRLRNWPPADDRPVLVFFPKGILEGSNETGQENVLE